MHFKSALTLLCGNILLSLTTTVVTGEAILPKDRGYFSISNFSPVTLKEAAKTPKEEKIVTPLEEKTPAILVDTIGKIFEKYKADLQKGQKWAEYVQEVERVIASDAAIQNALEQHSLKSTSLGDLESHYSELPRGIGTPQFQAVQGVDAKILPLSKYAKNAKEQAASQFNFLESTNTSYTAMSDYVTDYTQGPQASIGSLAALVVRDYAVRNKRLGEQPLFAGLPTTAYEGGYLMLSNMSDPAKKALLQHIKSNIGQLRILVQKSTPEFGTTPLTQAFTAAPSFQGEWAPPSIGSVENDICVELVAAQYRAIAQLAVIQSVRSGKPVNLHLTLVGQGAFNNNVDVMRKALKAVRETVADRNVNVFFHGFTLDDIEKIKRCAGIPDLRVMTKEEFFSK